MDLGNILENVQEDLTVSVARGAKSALVTQANRQSVEFVMLMFFPEYAGNKKIVQAANILFPIVLILIANILVINGKNPLIKAEHIRQGAKLALEAEVREVSDLFIPRLMPLALKYAAFGMENDGAAQIPNTNEITGSIASDKA